MRHRVAFGRINRRAQPHLDTRPFDAEMRALAESRRTTAEVGGKEWFASDMTIDDSGHFVTGIIGFETEETFTRFALDEFSWAKGARRIEEGASARTMVPFAVDLREARRWVCFATAQRITPATFVVAFEACLNAALRELNLTETDWEVDLTFDRAELDAWLEEHRDLSKLVVSARRTNPGREIDDDRQKMQALGARTLKKEYSAGHSRLTLKDNDTFTREIEGIEVGDLDVTITARVSGSTTTFSSKARAASDYIEEYGEDLVHGMVLVLEALEGYSRRQELRSSEGG